MPAVLAVVCCVILAALAALQAALAAGAPLGRFAWGGQHRVLPRDLRIGSGLSVVLYVAFALVILQAAELVTVFGDAVGRIAIWVLTAYFFVGFVMNAISRSKSERALMTPVSIVLAALCLIIAITGHVGH